MKTAVLSLSLALAAGSSWVGAQADELRGTWSGQWIPESGYDAATVRFVVDDGVVSGEMLNPEPLDFDSIEFDPGTLAVVAVGRTAEGQAVRIDARIEEFTRLNGTLTVGGTSGDVRLTRWTYRPR